MTLHEVAQRLGVETGYDSIGFPSARSDKDIAHDLLAKLPVHSGAYPCWHCSRGDASRDWQWDWQSSEYGEYSVGSGTFEQSVIALCERYLEGK